MYRTQLSYGNSCTGEQNPRRGFCGERCGTEVEARWKVSGASEKVPRAIIPRSPATRIVLVWQRTRALGATCCAAEVWRVF